MDEDASRAWPAALLLPQQATTSEGLNAALARINDYVRRARRSF